MNLAQLQQEATRLKTASIFRYGDPTTFAVRLLPDEVELPGPSKPQDYLTTLSNKLKVQLPEGGTVAVVGAGNCGLVAEALTAGAKKVVAIEPRMRFKAAADHICGLLKSIHPEADVSTFLGWPGKSASFGPLDVILWSEGLDEADKPLDYMRALLQLLKPTGLMVVEVNHGSITTFAGRINSFRPTAACFGQLLDQLAAKNEGSTPGRGNNTALYKVGRGLKVSEVEAKKPETQLPTFPKDAPPKKVAPMPPNPVNFGIDEPQPTEPLPKAKPKVPPPPPPADAPPQQAAAEEKPPEAPKKKTTKPKAEAPPPPPPPAEDEPEEPLGE